MLLLWRLLSLLLLLLLLLQLLLLLLLLLRRLLLRPLLLQPLLLSLLLLLLPLLGLHWRCMWSSHCDKLRSCPTWCPPRAVRRERTGGVQWLELYTVVTLLPQS